MGAQHLLCCGCKPAVQQVCLVVGVPAHTGVGRGLGKACLALHQQHRCTVHVPSRALLALEFLRRFTLAHRVSDVEDAHSSSATHHGDNHGTCIVAFVLASHSCRACAATLSQHSLPDTYTQVLHRVWASGTVLNPCAVAGCRAPAGDAQLAWTTRLLLPLVSLSRPLMPGPRQQLACVLGPA